MKWVWLVLLVACSKASAPPPAPKPAPAVVVAVAPDAAVVPPDAPPPPAETDAVEAAAYADLMTSDDPAGTEGDMNKRTHPGADLGQQIQDVKAASRPSGRIMLRAKKALDPTSVTVDVVVNKLVTAYMAGIKRCYRSVLDASKGAGGDLKLTLTISPPGRAEAKVTSFDASLDPCVAHLASTWRFPVPKDNNGEPTTGHFELVLALRPD